jgi:hypothetical protein
MTDGLVAQSRLRRAATMAMRRLDRDASERIPLQCWRSDEQWRKPDGVAVLRRLRIATRQGIARYTRSFLPAA